MMTTSVSFMPASASRRFDREGRNAPYPCFLIPHCSPCRPMLHCGPPAALPLSILSGWGDPPTSGYALWLLGLFGVSIGLPFFALAANNPLLQAWFVRTGHPNGPDPYFLYASSNIGSFLALLSYPVLLEPMFTLRTQNLIWTGFYGLLIVLIAGCGALLLRSPANAAILNMPVDDPDAPAPPGILRARWIFLAAVPSGLLLAVAAHLSTDVAAAPLLWV